MNVKKGEIWVCKEPYCGAQYQVIRAGNPTCHGNFTPRCCCGKDLVLKETLEHAEVGPAKQGSGKVNK